RTSGVVAHVAQRASDAEIAWRRPQKVAAARAPLRKPVGYIQTKIEDELLQLLRPVDRALRHVLHEARAQPLDFGTNCHAGAREEAGPRATEEDAIGFGEPIRFDIESEK